MADPRYTYTKKDLDLIASANKLIDVLNLYILNRLREIKQNDGNRRDNVLQYIGAIHAFLGIPFESGQVSKDLAIYTNQARPEKMFLTFPDFSAVQSLRTNLAEKTEDLERKLFKDFRISKDSELGTNLFQALTALKEVAKSDLLSTLPQAKGKDEAAAPREASPKKEAVPPVNEYPRLFDNQNQYAYIYLTVSNANKNDIYENVREELIKFAGKDSNAINKNANILGIQRDTPYGIERLKHLPRMVGRPVYALELRLSISHFNAWLSAGKVEKILQHTCGVVKYSNDGTKKSTPKIVTLPDGTTKEYDESLYQRFPARVVDGKLQMAAEPEAAAGTSPRNR